MVRVNEGRMAGDIFDGAWAPRVYDFGGTVTDLQKMNGELAYQILSQRDKALSFSRNQLIQEATRSSASGIRSVHERVADRRTRSDARNLFEERDEAVRERERRRRLFAGGV